MKDKERDSLDDLFQSKLYDIEAETYPEDWNAIANRLPESKVVPFIRYLRYVGAAAVCLLMIMGGIYFYNDNMINSPIAQEIKQKVEEEERLIEKMNKPSQIFESQNSAADASKPVVKSKKRMANAVQKSNIVDIVSVAPVVFIDSVSLLNEETNEVAEVAEEVNFSSKQIESEVGMASLLADAAPMDKKEKSAKKWGIGMGAGSISAGTDNSVSAIVLKSNQFKAEDLEFLNAAILNKEAPKTNIHHKTPVSFGLSVSRFLNDRFALQTGLNYSYLSSEWSTIADYSGETTQKLHMLGIPLSLSYKIAEWNRFLFYAAAGGMAEVNVAGKTKTKVLSKGEEVATLDEKIRMKEWLWSVNAGVGVSYPIIRFVSAFAEIGASYYFDNGSKIETIHSEKPFNVNLQIGFRLGF